MSDALRALIARVESAAGADADLDRLISHHVVYAPQPEWHLRLSLRDKWTVPAYTASLDAALSLAMPHGFIAALGCIAADGLPGCCICTSTDPVTEFWGLSAGGTDATGRLARATIAAALRARLAREGNDE